MDGNLSGKTEPEMSWKAAFLNTPGPRSVRSSLLLMAKGMCMGAADTIPGVSGGTIALITGIYEDLLAAIKSANIRMAAALLRLDLKTALSELHLRFLLPLFFGIALAVLSLARLMNHLITHHPVPTWSLFFGLIAASVWVVGRQVAKWEIPTAAAFAAGAAGAFVLVGLVPVTTPEDLWFVFASGVMAICAMILPGISGAFILLILGKYEFIIATLENPLIARNMLILAVFLSGCAVGLAGFSRFLKMLLQKYHAVTLAFLAGLMLGSMRKIWPWKETLETAVIHGKLRILKERNVIPDAFDADVMAALALVVLGFLVVVVLERVSRSRD